MAKGNTYVVVTELEMDSIFKPSKDWKKEYQEGSNEIIYTKCLKRNPNYQLKIYTSIRKDNGRGRGVGKDAIRVCAVNLKTDRGLVKTKRINRTVGWSDRLIDRVCDVWTTMRKFDGQVS